ncbi:Acyl-CoA thioesterase 8 [Clonorchis sinensis]|uniref:Acyl-CoA thioesterase 8 n=1 Tax=Clonorchis sinensis TaxID=79923 RepID=A0A8T1MHU4_CLOSI|nr:Acyl-CoA thioesterase 8 [Clonorchis sinensis]
MNIGDKFINELLDTKLIAEDRYRGERVFIPNPRTVYGGELMAQALVAASKTAPEGFKAHSLHCYFHSQSSVKHPNEYRVRRFRDSRSFSHRLVEAFPLIEGINGDDSRPVFRMDCSFKAPEEDPACFVPPMPNVPTADEVVDTQTFISRLNLNELPEVSKMRIQHYREFTKLSPMEIRLCEPEYIFGLKSNKVGRLHAWIRLKEPPTIALEPYRDATLTYFSDCVLIWGAITEPHPVSYLVTLNQSIWFHNPSVCPQADHWVLFQTRANYVGDALTLSYGGIWDDQGRLLASLAQQGLMRTQPMTPVSSSNRLLEEGVENGK